MKPRIALALTAGLLAASSAHAASWYTINGQIVRWSGKQSLRALSPTVFPPGTDIQNLILGSMVLWNIIPSTKWTYSYAMLPEEYPIEIDGINVTTAVPAEDLDPGVLGLTFLFNQGALWADMDIVFPDFPDGIGWNFEEDPGCEELFDPPAYGYNFLLAAIHEMGHALGLGHSPIGNEPAGTPWFVATMNPAYPTGGTVGDENIAEIWTDDRNGLRILYPPSGPSQPVYRDLANAGYTASTLLGFSLPVIFVPAIVSPGGTFTAQAGIQNFGNQNHIFIDHGFYLSLDDDVSPDDIFLGAVEWDIPFEDAFDYTVDIDLPADLAARDYFLVSRIDDALEVAENYEDNNEVTYCEPLTVRRLAPIMLTLGQQTIPHHVPWTGPTAQVTKPLNMAPMTWTIDAGPPGLVIHPSTGVISWANPIASQFQYAVTVRGTNSTGTTTGLFFLGVTIPPPACEGDVNGDGKTNVADFNILASHFGQTVPPNTSGDLTGNGIVNVSDFNILAGGFGCGL